MEIRGNLDLTLNEVQQVIIQTAAGSFPSAKIGRVVYRTDLVNLYMCVQVLPTAIWIELLSPNAMYVHNQLAAANPWIIDHNLNKSDVFVQAYDLLGRQIIPGEITVVNANRVSIAFTNGETGKAVVAVINASGAAGSGGIGGTGSLYIDDTGDVPGVAPLAGGTHSIALGDAVSIVASNFCNISGGQSNVIYTGSNHSNIGGGQSNTVTGNNSAVLSGITNAVAGNRSVINGGVSNTITGHFAAILGGNQNNVTSDYSIAGGYQNSITSNGIRNVILDGNLNIISSGSNSVILNGVSNYIENDDNIILGGNSNSISGTNPTNCLIGNGDGNMIRTGTGGTIINGISNSIHGDFATIINGSNNYASGAKSAIISGQNNTVLAARSLVGNGDTNSIDVDGVDSAVISGTNNLIFGIRSIIGSGTNNSIAGTDNAILCGSSSDIVGTSAQCSILGGVDNTITDATNCSILSGNLNSISSGNGSTIVAGKSNTINSLYSGVLSGQDNTINTSANYSAIVCGLLNQIGDYASSSSAQGQGAKPTQSFERALAGGSILTAGDAQYSDIVFSHQSTLATIEVLGSIVLGTLVSPINTTLFYKYKVAARDTSGTPGSFAYEGNGVLEWNVSGNIVLLASNGSAIYAGGNLSGASASAAVNTGLNTLEISGISGIATNTNWMVHIELHKVIV